MVSLDYISEVVGMPIPKEILAVERPRNTVVIAYGKNKDRYAVRKRVGCRNEGGRHLPVNGPTVGHIVGGEYVPLPDPGPGPVSSAGFELKGWACFELCERAAGDLLGELEAVYDARDAAKAWCIAVLRVCEPGVRDCELKAAYEESWLSEARPGVALSRNTVSKFLGDLGKARSRVAAFMRSRAAAVRADHHLLVDGTLKSDESSVNTLPGFSYKSRVKGSRDISVMYAFDLDGMEPVCSEAFPGNMLDITSYEAFIRDNGITRGLIVADKGIPASAARAQFASNPDLHYLNPVKRNSKLIATHSMLDFEGVLPGWEGVLFKKDRVNGRGKWLYAYRDAARAAKEEHDWIERARAKGDYDLAKLRSRQRAFGTVVLESDLDIDPAAAYRAYSERWNIEVSMRYYKSALEFDETRVHDDYSVIGSELCDFLSTVITWRLINLFRDAGLLEKMTYGKVMKILRRAKRVKVDGGEWELVRTAPSAMEVLQALELVPKPENPPKRKRGRPRKAEAGKGV